MTKLYMTTSLASTLYNTHPFHYITFPLNVQIFLSFYIIPLFIQIKKQRNNESVSLLYFYLIPRIAREIIGLISNKITPSKIDNPPNTPKYTVSETTS